MRGNWIVKCLEGQGKGFVARAETVDLLVTGRELGEWVEIRWQTYSSQIDDRDVTSRQIQD
jgi:hypothetical protein